MYRYRQIHVVGLMHVHGIIKCSDIPSIKSCPTFAASIFSDHVRTFFSLSNLIHISTVLGSSVIILKSTFNYVLSKYHNIQILRTMRTNICGCGMYQNVHGVVIFSRFQSLCVTNIDIYYMHILHTFLYGICHPPTIRIPKSIILGSKYKPVSRVSTSTGRC